ncbi:MAG: carboxypeptidase regulatory-like domain-containing protein [Silvibacterium sp.]
MNRRIVFLTVFLFLLFVCSGRSYAQFAQRGGVEGTVFDSSGAVVPGAQVRLLDLAQNQSRQVTTDAAGHFEFDNLTAGQYQLTAAHEGFETEKSQSVAVNLGAVAHYDFKLHTGSVRQSVTVSAEESGLETDKVSVDTNITTQQFEDLPLNGRNFTAIADLAPGISTYPQLNINPGGTYSVGAMFAMGGTQFTAGGAFQGSRDSGFYVNGVNINDNYESSISFEPSAEALGAGTVQVSDFSAAVGHDIAALTMQTKGGSSKFHGEAFEFLENTALNAVNPWTHANEIITGTPATKPVLHRNQFGGNLGGPVYIPKVLPWLRDRLFFFANYEDFIEHDGNQLVTASVPSSAEIGGDFSELLGSNPNPVQLYNPFYTTYNSQGVSSRPPIPNNRLDLATKPDGSPLIDPGAAAIQKALWPLPNVPNTPSNEVNYVAYQSPGISNYHIDTRFDATITAKDSLFVTWSKSNGSSTLTGGIPPSELYNFPTQDQAYLVTVNYVHIFTPQLTNEFIFGIGDGALVTLSSSQFGWYNSAANPLNSLFQNTGTGLTKGVFAVYAGNYAAPGVGEAFRAENESYQYSDNLDWVHGRHTLTAGFNYFRKSEIDWDIQRNVNFGGFSTSGGDLGYVGGDNMADLEMGVPNNLWVRYNINGGNATSPNYNIVFPSWGMYVNDKFRMTPKLTVSAGLRYELSIPDYTPDPAVAPCCAIYTATPDGGVLKYPGIAAGLSNRYLNTPKLDFAPRISIAYSVNPQRVIRAGYGIFYDTGASQISNNVGNAIYGTSAAVNYNVNNTTLGVPPDTPVLNLSNIFPVPQTTTLGSFPVSTGTGQGYEGDGQLTGITYYDQKSAPLPYYQRMMLDVQQQVGAHDVFTLSYAGAQGRKGQNEMNINLPPYQTGWIYGGGGSDPTYNAARPNNAGRFGDIYVIRPSLNSFYNALIVQYRHDFSNGLQITSNYTWGKTVSDYPWVNNLADNGASGGGAGGAQGIAIGGPSSGFQYPNLYSRGEANQSHRQRFVFSGIFAPVYGQQWNEGLKAAFTGWRLSGIVTMESGDALTVSNGGPGVACPANLAGSSVCPSGYGSSAQDGAGFDELSSSGNPNIGHFSKTFSQQFDTSKFSLPPMNVRGNSGLGTVRGPGQNNVDLSLGKTFAIYESLHLEFRLDAFNSFNHTQWDGINTVFPSGSAQYPFGQVNGAREARIGQVAAKLFF